GEHAQLESYRLALLYGRRGFALWAEGGPLIGVAFGAGRWDEVVERADAFLAGLGGESHYQASSAHTARGLVRLARGDDVGAKEDAERALELARPVADPQLRGGNMEIAAFILMSAGEERRAVQLLDETLEVIRELRQLSWLVVDLQSIAWGAWRLDRGGAV